MSVMPTEINPIMDGVSHQGAHFYNHFLKVIPGRVYLLESSG